MWVKQAKKLRMAIEIIFRVKYYKQYSPYTLNGLDGIVQNICHDLCCFQASTVRWVVTQVYAAIEEEIEFEAKKKGFEKEMTWKIQKGTYQDYLLTRLKEGHNSYRQSTEALYTLYYAVHEQPQVGLTAVYNAINLCNHEKVKTQKVMQTNINNEIYWQARFNWLAQLLVRIGGSLPENNESEYRQRLKDEWIMNVHKWCPFFFTLVFIDKKQY